MVALDSEEFSPGAKPVKHDKAKAAAEEVDLSGKVLNDRYQIFEKIGEGGYGAVYRAQQLKVGRQCAVKVLHASTARHATVIARFRREAKAASNLKDGHTIQVFDFDQTPDGNFFLAMEMVTGRSALMELRGGPLSTARVAHIVDGIAQSLGEAHALGIVHRDIKPENIYLDRRIGDDDYPKVLDFGTVKFASGSILDGGEVLTGVGQTIGTIEYMSPEQITGGTLDGRSDLYSLGVMAFEMLTGTLPFTGATSQKIAAAHLTEPPPVPSERAPQLGIPPAMDAIVLKLMAKKKADRYLTAADLQRDVRRLVPRATKPEAIAAAPPTLPVARGPSRTTLLIIAAVLVSILIAIVWRIGAGP